MNVKQTQMLKYILKYIQNAQSLNCVLLAYPSSYISKFQLNTARVSTVKSSINTEWRIYYKQTIKLKGHVENKQGESTRYYSVCIWILYDPTHRRTCTVLRVLGNAVR